MPVIVFLWVKNKNVIKKDEKSLKNFLIGETLVQTVFGKN